MVALIEQLLREMDENPEAAEKLVRRLSLGVVRDSTAAALVLEALLEKAATREDLEKLEERLERRIGEVSRRIDNLTKWIVGLLATIWATLAAILIPIALSMLG
ncbi:MAG: hypothetical protein DSY37_04585 [Hyperthermus sp.]|nr:MAG: hypothetical protein DSY37_04585 [Hyperthermus sp.]